MEKSIEELNNLLETKTYDVTTGADIKSEKANQKYADAIYDIVKKAIGIVKHLNETTYINFTNPTMGDYLTVDNKGEHDTASTVLINNNGIEITLRYNYWSKKFKPDRSDDEFSITTINKLLKKYGITIKDSHEEMGANDIYEIRFRQKKKEITTTESTNGNQKTRGRKKGSN